MGIHIFHPGSTTIQCFLVVSHKKIYFFSGWAVGLAYKRNVGDRNGHHIWSPVSSTAFGCVVVCATKEFGWIICSWVNHYSMFFSCLTQKKNIFSQDGRLD